MSLAKGFLQWKKLVAIAMIVVPWFFRDQLAASLDKKSELAQEVLSERDQQQQRQDEASDQRDMLMRLREIQTDLYIVDAKVDGADKDEIDARVKKSDLDLMSNYFEEEGKALQGNEDTFEGLIEKVDLDQATQKEIANIASQASTTADQLRAFDSNPDANQIEGLLDALADAQNKLVDGYDKLDQAATRERDDSAAKAGFFRGVAWVCTALGALLMGDWRKLFGGSDEGGEEKTEAKSPAGAVAGS